MKLVPCSYIGCKYRRPHWERPDETREHQMVEVPDDYEGEAFCSNECAVYNNLA